MTEEIGDWTYKRIRYRLSTLIEVLPLARARDESSEKLLKNIHDDLREIRAGLDQLQGDYK